MNQPLQITSASQWKQGEVVQLPSGKVAKLKKPDVLDLIMQDGKVPDALAPLIFSNPNADLSKLGQVELTPEVLTALIPTLNRMVKACFMEPRVADNPGEDEISVGDVDFKDKLYLFQWALGGEGQAATTFPQKQAGSVAGVQSGNGVQRSPQPATRLPNG